MSERERFEAWALKKLAKGDEKVCDPMLQRDEFGHYVSFIAQGAWEAWRDRCPDGWQSVPKELDLAMIEEFEEHLSEQGWSSDAAGEIDKQDLWDAQLAAAPKPT